MYLQHLERFGWSLLKKAVVIEYPVDGCCQLILGSLDILAGVCMCFQWVFDVCQPLKGYIHKRRPLTDVIQKKMN